MSAQTTKKKPPFWAVLIGTGFGTGFCPVAPGTAGAFLALLVWFGGSLVLSPVQLFWATLAMTLIFTVAGIWASDTLEKWWGKDPQRVTIDEMAGQWISLLAVTGAYWINGLIAFGLFRLFDIWKPLGIRKMEKFKGGWGIMADDLLAGLYALLSFLFLQEILWKQIMVPYLLPLIP